jgi:hypothetical protein
MCLAKLREQGNIFDEVFLLTKSGRQLTAELSASSMPDGKLSGYGTGYYCPQADGTEID